MLNWHLENLTNRAMDMNELPFGANVIPFGLEALVAEGAHGEASLNPEDILIMKEDAEAIEKAAQMASQTEETELR